MSKIKNLRGRPLGLIPSMNTHRTEKRRKERSEEGKLSRNTTTQMSCKKVSEDLLKYLKL
jgi:hypothetical protein